MCKLYIFVGTRRRGIVPLNSVSEASPMNAKFLRAALRVLVVQKNMRQVAAPLGKRRPPSVLASARRHLVYLTIAYLRDDIYGRDRKWRGSVVHRYISRWAKWFVFSLVLWARKKQTVAVTCGRHSLWQLYARYCRNGSTFNCSKTSVWSLGLRLHSSLDCCRVGCAD